jgi:hypothetical protein
VGGNRVWFGENRYANRCHQPGNRRLLRCADHPRRGAIDGYSNPEGYPPGLFPDLPRPVAACFWALAYFGLLAASAGALVGGIVGTVGAGMSREASRMVACPGCGDLVRAVDGTCPSCSCQLSASPTRPVARWESCLTHAGLGSAVGGVLGVIAGVLDLLVQGPILFGFTIPIWWGFCGSVVGAIAGGIAGVVWPRR